jgi:hypothetical protein
VAAKPAGYLENVAIPATYRYAEDRLAEYLSEIAIARFKGVRVDP